MSEIHRVVFSDFDGTIARRDVGNRLFHTFSGGKSDAIIPFWKSGEITSRECLTREAELFTGTEQEVYEFLDTIVLNSGFVEFERVCRENDTPLMVLSDGLDLYIRYILGRHDLSHIPIYSNRGWLENDGIRVDFPFPLGKCGRCGNCKGERIAEYREAADTECRVVFIGDGLSDTCAIDQADILFAKKDLQQYCADRNIAYTSFDTFDEITKKLIDDGYFDSTSR